MGGTPDPSRGRLQQSGPAALLVVLAADGERDRSQSIADVVVWAEAFTLVIENKVDADEGDRQFHRSRSGSRERSGASALYGF